MAKNSNSSKAGPSPNLSSNKTPQADVNSYAPLPQKQIHLDGSKNGLITKGSQ
jgi:hypothetical protein